jgi:hypothetical protein
MQTQAPHVPVPTRPAAALIPVIKIVVTRGEGFTRECGTPHEVSSFADADRVLSTMARTAPEHGGYHKVDFVVTFADGETYRGRYDLKREDIGAYDAIGQQMVRYLKLAAGTYCPPHWSAEDHAGYLARLAPERRASAVAFLATYAIGRDA